MNELDISASSVKSLTASLSGTAFNQKEAWHKEWEKAQLQQSKQNELYKESNKSADLEGRSSGVDKLNMEQAIGFQETIPSGVKAAGIEFDTTTIKNVNKTNDVPHIKIDTSTAIKTSDLGVVQVKSFAVGNNSEKEAVLQRKNIENLAEKYTSKFNMQNLSLVINKNGIKIIFRDYRMSEEKINLIINEIKDELGKMNLPVSDTMVNGLNYNENNY
jgi:hypothetical protein